MIYFESTVASLSEGFGPVEVEVLPASIADEVSAEGEALAGGPTAVSEDLSATPPSPQPEV